MEPTSFDESNMVLHKPQEMTHDECSSLATWIGTVDKFPIVISCWKLTEIELEEIIKTKRVWLVVYGETMPPVQLHGTNPFKS